MAGINKAARSIRKSIYATESYSNNTSSKPCIFLSHISIDKETVIEIGEYIMKYGDIDIYLDIYDEELQQAVSNGNAHAVTSHIEKGLLESTHIMCLISKETKNSWWVPYEIGFAKNSEKEISSLRLKGNFSLPDFLKIGKILNGTKSLNEYIEEISRKHRIKKGYSVINESLESHTATNHPLDPYLNWKE